MITLEEIVTPTNLSSFTTVLDVTYTTATDGAISNGTRFNNIEILTLTTGSGNDTITITPTTSYGWATSGADNDTINTSGFGGSLTSGASLIADQFALGIAATDVSDRFIYDAAIGNLLFDQDGTGSTAAIHIVTLGTKPTLSNTYIAVIA